MEKNSSKKTKHIKNHVLLIKDKIEKGDTEIWYEPTGRMWSDVVTKPSQGEAFRVFRGELVNVSKDYDDEIERLNMYPDLLAPDEDTEKLLQEDRAVLVKALMPQVISRNPKAVVKIISP